MTSPKALVSADVRSRPVAEWAAFEAQVRFGVPLADDFAANSEITAKPKGNPRGRPWKKGQSGNPGGRPKDVHGIAALARTFSAEAIEKLVELMRDKTMPPRAVIAAIDSILDRGLGKPMQPMQQQQIDADGQPISPSFNVIISEYANPAAPQEAADRLLSMQDHRQHKR